MAEQAKKDTEEQAEFRAHCRTWLAENVPEQPAFRLPQSPLEIMTTEQLDYLCAWQQNAYEAGLVGCDYPQEYGGGSRTDCQRVANEEMQRAGTPFFPNIIGLGMAAPTVFFHGSDELKRTLLPRLFSAEELWCQGFSEPGAGSDLANIQTFAERRGDKWVINGQKVWTTLAHFAHWMILLCRTDKGEKYKGLSYFVVPIKAALNQGVTVRPLIKMSGETGFNEVFFEDLEIADDYRLGAVGDGWSVAMTTLTHERGAGAFLTPASGLGGSRSGSAGAYALIELARRCDRHGQRAADDAVLRDRIMQLIIRQEGIQQTMRRRQVAALTEHPMRIPLQSKLLTTELMQDIAQLALEIEGAAGSLYLGDDNAPDAGKWPLAYMNSFGGTIAAGTSEIQRNILGERVLGLPKSK